MIAINDPLLRLGAMMARLSLLPRIIRLTCCINEVGGA
jgi:hypothetical protein